MPIVSRKRIWRLQKRFEGKRKMKLILYSWNANNEQILVDNLIKLGFEVVCFRKECRHYTRDMELAMEMIPFIHAQGAEAVVSFNYFPMVSMICNTCQIPYYAWVYDCPHFTLYAKQIGLPCNHIGIFDREMARQLEGYGVNTVHHVPLAVDTACFDAVISQATPQEKDRFRCDISFVGSLYTDAYNYYDRLFGGEDAVKQTNLQKGSAECGSRQEKQPETDCESRQEECPETGWEAIASGISRQCFAYHEDYLRQAVTDGKIDLHGIQVRMEKQGLMLGEDYYAKAEDIFLAAVLEKKVTVEERRILLTRLAERFAISDGDGDRGSHFRLYTGSDTAGLPELDSCNCGIVDYHTQMPLVFAGSRINLNISLRSIHSGIPLRVLDIMACGGFVLSNWQPEIAEYFEEGVEIVTFDSREDCLEKTAYYLSHEEERRQIAANGKRKVQEKFSYQNGLDRLFA